MRRALLGLVIAIGLSGMAQASDFIVVNSTDPAVTKGQTFDAGAQIPVGVGKTVTLMRPSGEISTLRGAAGGVRAPGLRVATSDNARFDALRALVEPPPAGRTFGARRGGMCAPADTLLSMDAILEAANTGCKTQAREALTAYIARAEGKAPADN